MATPQKQVCTICGGELIKRDDAFVCDSCGSTFRFSSSHEEYSAEYATAAALSLAMDFDGAAAIYRKLADDTNAAEAYFFAMLCDYGVLYVQDIDGTYRPTFCDVVNIPINDNLDYVSAIKYASEEQRAEYFAKSDELERVRRETLSLIGSSNYDVFLCQKINRIGTDPKEKIRTHEYEFSLNLFRELSARGYKVFLSELSLGGGVESDSSIFSALYSSKCMIVVGASRENLNSPWVRSEWTRYLNLIKRGIKPQGSIIPISLGGAEVLPRGLSNLQTLSVSSFGYETALQNRVQELCRPKVQAVVPPTQQTIPPQTLGSSINNLVSSIKNVAATGLNAAAQGINKGAQAIKSSVTSYEQSAQEASRRKEEERVQREKQRAEKREANRKKVKAITTILTILILCIAVALVGLGMWYFNRDRGDEIDKDDDIELPDIEASEVYDCVNISEAFESGVDYKYTHSL